MPYLAITGLTTDNPYEDVETCRGFVLLNHPSIPNILTLSRFSEEGYSRYTEGIAKVTGRSITGSPIVEGALYRKEQSKCNFLATLPMLKLFEELLVTQSQGNVITVRDRWLKDYHFDYNGYINLPDEKWKTPLAGDRYLLQFELFEV